VFTKPLDGLFVTIRWATDFDQWNLFVYAPDGTLAAQGDSLDSNAQAVLIPHPANGTYRVVAVPFYMDATMTYVGQARLLLDRDARLARNTVLAPRLSTVPPHDFHIACDKLDPTSTETNDGCTDVPPLPSVPLGWRFGGGFTNSCYLDERLGLNTSQVPPTVPKGGVRRCLRFSNDIRNSGPGPLILQADFLKDLVGSFEPGVLGPCTMQQVLVRADGSTLPARDAGPCEFHVAHAHFHYLSFAKFEMLPVTGPDLNLSATPVTTGRKLGYCLIDVDFWGDITQDAQLNPRVYSFPTCDTPDPHASLSARTPIQKMGISPGWGDIYTWDLPDQFLDITDVPPGTYDVVSIANPDCLLEESAAGIEGSATRIQLTRTSVTVVKTFDPFPVPGCTVPTPAP
jgi:hypothetical protein